MQNKKTKNEKQMEVSVHHLVLKVTPRIWACAAQTELAAADI